MANPSMHVQVNEEGPREGFQFERTRVPTDRKIALIDSLSKTGITRIRVASFVNPKRVPGMADADEVVRGLTRRPGVSYEALWLNDQGFMRALAASAWLDVHGNVSLSASEALLVRNQGRTLAQQLDLQHQAMELYHQHGVDVRRAAIQAAFGCNFEGDIPVQRALATVSMAKAIALEHGFNLDSVVLADSMAWATPLSIRRLVGAVQDAYPELAITLHLHDTRGMAVANAAAGLDMGVRSFDTSIAGLGGCPFAGHQGAAGNLCTEDLVFMCHEMGFDTGIELDALLESARLAEDVVQHPLPGSVMRGGSLQALRVRAGRGVTTV